MDRAAWMRPQPRHRRLIPMPVSERFWSKALADGTGCWVWQHSRSSDGYGRIKVGGVVEYAHRVAYKLVEGSIPDGLQVLHQCDNPPCVNPNHLFLGTHADNMADMTTKGRAPHHPGADNGRAKLTSATVQQIRERYASGETQTALAGEFYIGQTQVSRIVRGESWQTDDDG